MTFNFNHDLLAKESIRGNVLALQVQAKRYAATEKTSRKLKESIDAG